MYNIMIIIYLKFEGVGYVVFLNNFKLLNDCIFDVALAIEIIYYNIVVVKDVKQKNNNLNLREGVKSLKKLFKN